ncbi:MAG: hypothetical protein ABTQ30_12955 [Rhizobiaceae bacterium]
MTIDAIEHQRLEEFPSLLWVQIKTADGIVGLAETLFGARAVESYIHETVAVLLGKDPLQVDRHSRFLLNAFVGFSGTGVEMRRTSAIDIVLWDIFGQAVGRPIHQLLGGLSRDKVRIYRLFSFRIFLGWSRIPLKPVHDDAVSLTCI